MWQRFTERARRVVFCAQDEAAKLGKNYVSTEHLLLGLVREADCAAARIQQNRSDISSGRGLIVPVDRPAHLTGSRSAGPDFIVSTAPQCLARAGT